MVLDASPQLSELEEARRAARTSTRRAPHCRTRPKRLTGNSRASAAGSLIDADGPVGDVQASVVKTVREALERDRGTSI